MKEIRGINLV